MSNIQYAVCHLQRGSGSDSGISCHIERKDAKDKTYVPENADAKRTHLNRELIKFPQGVANRTEAIQYRIDHAGLHRKVGKNQTKAIRIILTGTHEQMMKLQRDGKLDQWIKANLSWLKDTFGEENLVSCVLHMDEKTPHLHATIIPIVTTERRRKEREGDKKYATKSGPRLSADDVMARGKLFQYQNTYAIAMKPFGLQRGVVGSTARHKTNGQYYREQMLKYEDDIERLQAEVEKAREGRSKILSFFGTGELAEAKKKLSDKDKQIEKLQQRITLLEQEQLQLKEQRNIAMVIWQRLTRLSNEQKWQNERILLTKQQLKSRSNVLMLLTERSIRIVIVCHRVQRSQVFACRLAIQTYQAFAFKLRWKMRYLRMRSISSGTILLYKSI